MGSYCVKFFNILKFGFICFTILGKFFFLCNHGHCQRLKFKYDHLPILFLFLKLFFLKSFQFIKLEKELGKKKID
jgi:hypothetical protein